MDQKYELSTVMPCYNEIKALPQLIERYSNVKNNINYQFVIIDNGSTDGTWDYLQKVIQDPKNDFIKIIRIKKNIGYGNGLFIGLKECDAEIVGWSHGDLQCPPEDVFKAYAIYKDINNKKVIVKGKRKVRNWKELLLSYGLDFYIFIVLFRVLNDINGQPKVFSRDFLNSFKNPPKEFSFDLYVQYKAIKEGYDITSFPVKYEKRIYGFSKWAYSTLSKFSTIKGFVRDALKMRFGIIK